MQKVILILCIVIDIKGLHSISTKIKSQNKPSVGIFSFVSRNINVKKQKQPTPDAF